MKLDELTILLGQFGRYQKVRYVLIGIFSTISALHAINMVFVGAQPSFSCALPEVNLTSTPLHNTSHREMLALFLPPEEPCRHYDVEERLRQLAEVDYNMTSLLSSSMTSNVTQVACTDGYWYSTSEYESTIASDFNLVCENKYWRSTSRSVFFGGRLVGAVVFGQLSDRFGRRPMFFVGVATLLVAGVVASFAPNMFVFLPMYFLQGAAHTGAFLVAYILATELVGPNYRGLVGFGLQIFYGAGYVLLAGLAYLIRSWRYLELAITLPAILCGLYWWFLPESIPWLLSRGRDTEAEAIVMQAAKENGVTLDPGVMQALKQDASLRGNKKQYHVLDCLKTRRMAALSLNVWFSWLVNSFVFYGISLNSENLSGDPYLNFCLVGVVGILAYLACLLVVNKTGRRLSLVACLGLAGGACMVAAFLTSKEEAASKTANKVLVLLGKFSITASYSIIYLMAAEIFPTVIRNIGMGVASMSARIGGIFAPIVLELSAVWDGLPLLVFGILSLMAALTGMLLPETGGMSLPQTLGDIEIGVPQDSSDKTKPDSLCLQEVNKKENPVT